MELKKFISTLEPVVKETWESNKQMRVTPYNKDFKIENFILRIPPYKYLLDLPKEISNHSFSDELIEYIKRKFIGYIVEPRIYLTDQNIENLIQKMIELSLSILLEEMKKDSSLTIDDIEMDSGKYP